MTQDTTTNVDSIEIEKFDELAHRWWDKESEFKPLHIINPLRLSWIDSFAQINQKQVLDVGCGGGILSDSMAHKGAFVTGIDLSEKALQVAQLQAMEANTPHVQYQKITVEALATERAGSFDVVTCMEMIEHVPDPQSIFTAIAQLLKPNGWAFFATLNRNPRSFALGIVAAEYLLNLVPKGTHEYKRFLRPSEMAQMARASGLKLVSQKGLHYNPFIHQAKLVNDVGVNYMQAYRKEG